MIYFAALGVSFNFNIQPHYIQPCYTQPLYTQPLYTQPHYTQPRYTHPLTLRAHVILATLHRQKLSFNFVEESYSK